MMTCPGFEQLLDYLDGRLDQAATESVAAHLALGCGQCDAARSWRQRVMIIAGSDDSIEPLPWVLKRAVSIFNKPRVPINAVARAGRLVASLVFDSLSRPAVAGARSSGGEGRQLMYQANGYSIDLQLAGSDQRRAEVTGQILREGELSFESVSGLELELMRNGKAILSAVTTERGEFAIPAIEFGIYDLRVNLNEGSVTILGLSIAEC